jgi:tetratricopeptide (TPR) repeat protein
LLTLLIAFVSAFLIGFLLWELVGSILLSVIIGVLVVVGINFLTGKLIMKKMSALMQDVEKDLKSERYELAVEKLLGGYRFSKWQLFVKKQLNANIGSIRYMQKKFDESLPYLKDSFIKSWPSMCMLASHYYRKQNYKEAYKIMEKTVSANSKEAFPYSLYAWFLTEKGEVDKAIKILSRAASKLPLDEKISSELEAMKNKKKLKIQNYGALWLQMHLGKMPDGVRPYQAFAVNQRVKRR